MDSNNFKVLVNENIRKLFENNNSDNRHRAITFDETTLEDGPSNVHPNEVNLDTYLTKKIKLKGCGIMSAAMDTVTEKELALELAKMGGVGIIHRNMSIETQVDMVKWVRNKINSGGMIDNPVCFYEKNRLSDIQECMIKNKWTFTSFPILNDNKELVGLVTKDEMCFVENNNPQLFEIMKNLSDVIIIEEGTNSVDAYKLMKEKHIKKLPVINKNNNLIGMYVWNDIRENLNKIDMYSLDEDGHFLVGAAIGLGDNEFERAESLIMNGCKLIVIDTSHGACEMTLDMINKIKSKYNVELIVGNVASYRSTKYLLSGKYKPDAIKTGISVGCLGKDTRVLMANGIYKNINEIMEGEYVINMNGDPVKVKKIFITNKETIEVQTTNWYNKTIVTENHKYWININKINTINENDNNDIKNKYKWKEIGKLNSNNQSLLMPKNIKFNIKDNIIFDLAKYCNKVGSLNGYNGNNGNNGYIESCYNLGYIFGSYLDNENTKIKLINNNDKNNTEIKSILWNYGERNCKEKINKLVNCLINIVGKSFIKFQNIDKYKVWCNNEIIVNLLLSFNKNENKNLFANYICKNRDYIQGILDGLVDLNSEKIGNYIYFGSRMRIIELFNICCMINRKTYTNLIYTKNQLDSITLYPKLCDQISESKYYNSKIYSKNRGNKVKVWDIEVNCPTHSFIANNCIVHNSICTTRRVTGHGMPQLTAIYETWRAINELNLEIPIIADGGIRYSGDIVKAIAVGASAFMMGNIFAGTDESPGKIIESEGVKYKMIRGMGSKSAMEERNGSRLRYFNINKNNVNIDRLSNQQKMKLVPEGVEGLIKYNGNVEQVMNKLLGGIRAGLAHSGGRDINSFRENAIMWEQNYTGILEANPHSLKKIID